MKIRNLSLTILAAFVLSGCTNEDLTTSENVVPTQMEEPVQAIVPGKAIVLFSDELIEVIEQDLERGMVMTKSSGLNTLTTSLNVSAMERVFPYAGEYEERTRAAGLHKWYRLTFDTEIPVTRASQDLSQFPGIEAVEPVRNIKSTAIFNDPKFSQQWHYYNDGKLTSTHEAGADINVVPVWENYTTGDPEVIVSIVDGGIDYEHEDLKDNYVGGYNFVSNTTRIVAHDHGTHVAGTVAAVNNNGIGVAGVAGGDKKNGTKGVGLLSCQIFQPNPNDPSKDLGGDGASAIKWGADNGAVISQNSWGYTYETDAEQAAATIPGHLKAAIDYFIANAGMDASGKNQVGPMKGGVVIFAAGNDGREHDPIGKYDPVICVGSIGPDFTRAYYSNYGDWVDIAAPGGNSQYNQGEVLSTIPGNKYGFMQGTSMACPHVSGVAALVVSHFKGQGFTNTTLREKLIKGANSSVMSKNAKIGPLVDAFGAMTYGGTKPPANVQSASASVKSNSITLTWKVTADPDDKKAYGYIVVAAADRNKLESLNPTSIPAEISTVVVMTEDLKVGAEISGTVTDLEFSKDYYAAVIGFDYNRNYSKLSPIYSVKTEGNNPPIISTDYEGDIKVKSHETAKVVWQISDPDEHPLKVNFTPGSKATTLTSNPDGTYTMTIVGNADEPGLYDAVFEVTDNYEAKTTKTVRYEILENHAPVIVKDIKDMIFDVEGWKFSIDMNEHLSDPDGETLKFAISISDKNVLHINPKDNILNATTLSYGVTDVKIVASDSRGLTCTLIFKVLVKDSSKPVEMFPNPVKDYLNISTMDVAQTSIRILSSTGKVFYDETSDVSAFEPALIDMRSYPPGLYTVDVEFNGEKYRRTIVKL